MTEYRCRYCNALLFKADLSNEVVAVIEIKCRHSKCGMMNLFALRVPVAV